MNSVKRNRKKSEKQFKQEQDFEKDPARCGNCKYKTIRRFFVKVVGMVNGKPTCSQGKFQIKDYSICNAWAGFHGESLE